MESKVTSTLTKIAAVFLSILFVLVGTILPIYASLTTMTETKTLVKVVQKVDLQEFVRNDQAVTDELEKLGLQGELVDALVTSGVAAELTELYATDVTNALNGKEEPAQLTATALKQTVNAHMDEIYQIAAAKSKKAISKEIVAGRINKALDQNAQRYVDLLPKPERIKEIVSSKTVSSLVKVFANPSIVVSLAIVTLLLAGGIYACRWRRCNGFFWLGIDCAVCGILLLLISILINNHAVTKTVTDWISIQSTWIDAVISIYANGLLLGALAYIVMAMLCLGVLALIRKRSAKKAGLPDAAPTAHATES